MSWLNPVFHPLKTTIILVLYRSNSPDGFNKLMIRKGNNAALALDLLGRLLSDAEVVLA